MTRGTRQVDDARGRSVTLLDPLRMHLLGRDDTIGPANLRAIAEEIEPRLARHARLKIVGAVALVITLFFLNMYSERLFIGAPVSWRLPPMLIAAASALLPIVFVYFAYQRLRRASFERVLPVLLKHRRCAHCGYDIRGLVPDRQGRATICPECGCAWRIDDAQIAARLATAATGGSFFGGMSQRTTVVLLIVLAVMGALGLVLAVLMR